MRAMSERLHSLAARGALLSVAAFTALAALLSDSSLAARASGHTFIIDAINVGVLIMVAVGLADIVWNDLLRRGMIWPTFPARARHVVCVAVYCALGIVCGIRAFLSAGEAHLALSVGLYYLAMSAWAMLEAAALAHEDRHAA